MKLEKLAKKGGVADIVTLMIIIGLSIALIVAVVVPMINDATNRSEKNETQMSKLDSYVSTTLSTNGV